MRRGGPESTRRLYEKLQSQGEARAKARCGVHSESEASTASTVSSGSTPRRAISPGRSRSTDWTVIWENEHHKVRKEMIRDVFCRLGTVAQIDVFGPLEESIMEISWTRRGSQSTSAMWRSRGEGEKRVLWLNPPAVSIPDCLIKVKEFKNRAIMIIPDWQDQNWFEEVWPMTTKYHFYSNKIKLYEGEQPLWGSWALLLDGSSNMTGGNQLKLHQKGDQRNQKGDQGNMMISAVEKQMNSSARRRYRRKKLENDKDQIKRSKKSQ